jgi:MFS family permease
LRLPRLRPDLAPLRESRDFRLVVVGSFLSGLGAQATLVALPYQVYIQTRSALLVGLLGAVELAAIGDPAIGVLYALAALLAAFVSLENVVVCAIVPNLVDRRRLRGALALEYGLGTLTMVVGPALRKHGGDHRRPYREQRSRHAERHRHQVDRERSEQRLVAAYIAQPFDDRWPR